MKIPLFKFLLKNYDKIVLLVILVIASFYRLYRIMDYMTFLGDEGRDALIVYDILHGHLTLLGPTASVGGFFLGPIYYYFMTPFLWLFNYNPVGPAVMVAIFGIATVGLIYKVGKEFFGPIVGLIAAALYSVSPLVVSYSRSSWNPNLMPFFSLLTLYILYKALKNDSSKWLIICGLLLGMTMQLHYLTIFLGVIIAIYILLIRGKSLHRTFKDYVLIFVGFIVGWSPFIAFEFRHKFLNVMSILNFIFHSGETGGNDNFFGIIGNVFFRLFGRLLTYFPPPEQISSGQHPNIGWWYYATLFLAIGCIINLVVRVIKSHRSSLNFSRYSLLLIWLLIGVGLFGFYRKSIHDYYFGFMFPLPFFLVGIFISNLLKFKIGRILGIIILLSITWINLQGIPFRSTPNRQLVQVEQISKFVIDKTGGRPFNFAIVTGGNSDHAYRYFFTLWNKEPTIIQNVQIDPKRETVTDQLLVVCEMDPCHPLGYSIWEIAGFGRAEIADSWSVSVVKVLKLAHYKGE
ncbi:MAG: glycosyltransferase family 39 protein [bacterium]|nr:glycosyltransferase family 39 protein [bacterium]